ncbi:hypothetical protein FRC12_004628 [Ceratobasidium sp. 428]|nr:hypothetical protein FRC12_004628 [Ceratobasidium sp. 428]
MIVTRDQSVPIPASEDYVAPYVIYLSVCLPIGGLGLFLWLGYLAFLGDLLLWRPGAKVLLQDLRLPANHPATPGTLVIPLPYSVLVWRKHRTFWHKLKLYRFRDYTICRIWKSRQYNNGNLRPIPLRPLTAHPGPIQTHKTPIIDPETGSLDGQDITDADTRSHWSTDEPAPPKAGLVPQQLAQAITRLGHIKGVFQRGTTPVLPVLPTSPTI